MTRQHDTSRHDSTLRARTDRRYIRSTHRSERFTPGTLSCPDVREIRWFLHLRFARDVPGKAPVQRSSANGRAISAGTSDAS